MWAEEKQHYYMTPDETAVIELKAAALGHSNRWHCEVAKVTHQDIDPASLGLTLGRRGQSEVRPSCPGSIPWLASAWQPIGKSRLTSTQHKWTQHWLFIGYSRWKRIRIFQIAFQCRLHGALKDLDANDSSIHSINVYWTPTRYQIGSIRISRGESWEF